jgi:hypothetical protein
MNITAKLTGYPRIRPARELKWALERRWSGWPSMRESSACSPSAPTLEPTGLVGLAFALRETHVALGGGETQPQPSEADTRRVARRSLVLRCALVIGAVITAADLDAKRPADGISLLRPDEVLGGRLARALAADAALPADDLDLSLDTGDIHRRSARSGPRRSSLLAAGSLKAPGRPLRRSCR